MFDQTSCAAMPGGKSRQYPDMFLNTPGKKAGMKKDRDKTTAIRPLRVDKGSKKILEIS